MEYYVHDLNPIAFSIGDLVLPWYWLVYVAGFFFIYSYGRRLARSQNLILSKNDWIDYMVWGWLGLLLGGRLFYALVYNLEYFVSHPAEIYQLWKGGMSFHGGLLGVLLTIYILSRRKKQDFFLPMDLVASSIPFVLGFGRIANFINGELAGRVASIPWAVVFPKYYDQLPRHPSQLYQSATEGFLLFVILRWQRHRLSNSGTISCFFLIGYGSFRFVTEFFRNPDPQVGFLLGFLTMGQLLCLVMILIGFALLRFRQTYSSTSESV
ncbi:Prolipoprotein diacylglyceryl transferase [Pseudobacteriovorax antillogorgiicola]|uniref:Phosphatidylglycerol--prolipoprotein diacylglyceryl transferase n=2 Tax=Pseudobacteriovorax antillogorgiicola TaxID=1513793 RepID=A0A1Y6CIT9_9BACT|nr:prolipoprotein diacylglyceryl transferase [Pseudobacteriovorax antillogorgiicola]SMF56586.1 Prolipoprotein diacylglyceryl transferase [Pseudobacteriovorax antillogorgiicola]